MTITAAIVAALCAVTILVFAGGKDEPAAAPCKSNVETAASGACETEPDSAISACQTATGTDCVQAAKDIVGSSPGPVAPEPAAAGSP